MSVTRQKIPLNAARFPLVSTKGQRAVYIPGLDAVNRTPKAYIGDETTLDANLPQVLYGENFMPVTEGLRSVGYSQLIVPTVNADFDQIFALRDDQENVVLYSPSQGKNYVYDTVVGLWADNLWPTIWAPTVLDATLDYTASKVTYAYVDGKTFVCYSRLKSNAGTPTDMSIMFWNPVTQLLEPAGALLANVPFPAGEIDGISSSSGYLIIWSGIEVAWAPFNAIAFDYEPYVNGAFTGGGRQVPEDVQGRITAIIAVSGGLVLFTARNAVGASYHAQNLSAPWVFREVANAGGLASYEQATVEGSLGYIVAYTTAGVQKISLNSAEEVHPEVSDFLAGRQLETYNFGNQLLTQGAVSLDFYTKLTIIGNRYLVISYGTYPGIFSYALVYDSSLKRWGKLRIVHRDCFYYNYGSITAGLTYSMMADVTYADTTPLTYAAMNQQSSPLVAAQHSMAFLLETGEVKIAVWSDQTRDVEDVAVVILGRIQLSRMTNTQFNRLEVEQQASGRAYLQPSATGGKLEATVPLIEVDNDAGYKTYGELVDCRNFNLIVEGTFNLSTLIVEGTKSGGI